MSSSLAFSLPGWGSVARSICPPSLHDTLTLTQLWQVAATNLEACGRSIPGAPGQIHPASALEGELKAERVLAVLPAINNLQSQYKVCDFYCQLPIAEFLQRFHIVDLLFPASEPFRVHCRAGACRWSEGVPALQRLQSADQADLIARRDPLLRSGHDGLDLQPQNVDLFGRTASISAMADLGLPRLHSVDDQMQVCS